MSTQRSHDALRPTTIEAYPTGAAGSVIITQGRTTVLCTASVAEEVPKWLVDRETGVATRGWVTAEYSMLPGSTPQRKRRGPDSRGTEIQRLIGRCLRAAVNLERMPGLAVTCDCDVLLADGGTRTASITGAFVALAQALATTRARDLLADDPIIGPIAAVSVGVIDGVERLDLDYELDVNAEVDMNVAMNHAGEFVEVQATGEQGTFRRGQLDTLLDLATNGIEQLVAIQSATLGQLTS
ncbi:MAG: ribonuclease PH [Phycisphaerales bacterium]|nr:ribonuclease PH [Phycisphaerales bacterium]